ncbi:MAG: oligopeptide/dipeptide ABC transporter ATP-binding protein [Rubrivivax sp.]
MWSAAPSFDEAARPRPRIRLTGDPPSPLALPSGCRFAGRCPAAEPACSAAEPPLAEVSPGHWVRCRRVRVEGGLPQPVVAG